MPLTAEQTQLTKIKEKRILKEIKEIQQTPIDPDNSIYEASPGCYVCINDEDITNHKIMIIGPEDTPYENGFYMFDYTYNKNHPFEAPFVKYLTTDGTVRFNPNLYTNGKVCLSILGTWQGPGWKSVMNLRSVVLSIQSLLHDFPIINEPGFENTKQTDNISIQYNYYLTYYNYEIAILEILKNIDNQSFSYITNFKEEIKSEFKKNYKILSDNLKSFQITIGEHIVSRVIYFIKKEHHLDFINLNSFFHQLYMFE